MLICNNCKAECADNMQFCNNCGHKLGEEKIEEKEVETRAAIAPKKKKKKGLIALIALIIILIAAHFTIKTIIDPEKQIAKMNEDFQSKDAKHFLKNFEIEKGTYTDPEGYYAYIQNETWSSVREKLLNNVRKFKQKDMFDPVVDMNGNDMIRIVEKPFLGGLYKKATFEIVPIRVEIESEYNDIQFTHGKKTIDLNDESATTFGQFLPGNYEWSLVQKSDYGSLKKEGKMYISEDANNNKYTYELDYTPTETEVQSNNMEATLFVNGVSTKKTIDELNPLGPIPFDGSAKIHAEVLVNGKTEKSNEAVVNGDRTVLNFKYIDDQIAADEKSEELDNLVMNHESKIDDFYLRFRQAHESDVNNRRYDATSYYVVAGTELEKIYKGYFKDFKKGDEISNHSNYMSNLKAINDHTFTFSTEENYTFFSHENETIEYFFKKQYTIVTSADSYKISKIDSEKVNEKRYKTEEDDYDYD